MDRCVSTPVLLPKDILLGSTHPTSTPVTTRMGLSFRRTSFKGLGPQ